MAGDALSEATLQASLHDIRLPAEASGGWIAEASATVLLACLLALVLGTVARLATARAQRPAQAPETLPPRMLQRRDLLLQLKACAPDRFAALQPRLYRKDAPSLEELRALLCEVSGKGTAPHG